MKFEEAAELIQKLKIRPSETELLEIYGLYKQASIGDCNIEKPGLLDQKGRYKWERWNSLKGVSKEEASENYVKCVEKLIEKYGI